MKRRRNKLTEKRNSRAHYLRNYETIRAKTKAKRIEYRHAKRVILLEALKAGCVDCGEPDPVVLDFDHRDRSDKHFGIAQATHDSMGVERFRVEIAKCDVRCANCHRRRTAIQMMWWKTKI